MMTVIMMIVMMKLMMMTCLLLLMPLSRESEEEAVGREGSELSREELVSILNRIFYCFIVSLHIASVVFQHYFTVNKETISVKY